MITPFNRRELLVTFSYREKERVLNLLTDHRVDYRLKEVPLGGAMRRDSTRSEFSCQYYIYVHPKDIEWAKHLINV